MSNIEELYRIADQIVLDYNTQAVPGWTIRDYIAHVLQDHGDACAAAERERAAEIAEGFTRAPMDYIDWSPGPAADDRARMIAQAIRTAPPATPDPR